MFGSVTKRVKNRFARRDVSVSRRSNDERGDRRGDDGDGEPGHQHEERDTRRAAPCRSVGRNGERGQRSVLGPDDHRADDQHRGVDDDPDGRDQRRDRHEAEERDRRHAVLVHPRLEQGPDDHVAGAAAHLQARLVRRLGPGGLDLDDAELAELVEVELPDPVDEVVGVLAEDVGHDDVLAGRLHRRASTELDRHDADVGDQQLRPGRRCTRAG